MMSNVLAGMPRYTRGFEVAALAHRAGMAHRAVQERLVDALVVPLRHADRQVVAFFVDDSERRVALTRQMLGAHLRQRLEDPVRKARHVLAARRSVLEVFLDVGVFDGAIAAEALPEIDAEDERKHGRDGQHQHHHPYPALAIQLGEPAVLAGARHRRFVHLGLPAIRRGTFRFDAPWRSPIRRQARPQILVAAHEHRRGIRRAACLRSQPTGDDALQRRDHGIGRCLDPRSCRRAMRAAAASAPCRAPPAVSATSPGERRCAARTASGWPSRAPRRRPGSSAAIALPSDGTRRTRFEIRPPARAEAAPAGRSACGGARPAVSSQQTAPGSSPSAALIRGATERCVGPRAIGDRRAHGREILDDRERGFTLVPGPAHGQSFDAVAARRAGPSSLARHEPIVERVVRERRHRRTKSRPRLSRCRSTQLHRCSHSGCPTSRRRP